MKVAIIGGGIAGLATAAHLIQQGVQVEVYEQCIVPSKVGMGFIMLSNGLQMLQELDLLAKAKKLGHPTHFFSLKNPTGTTILETPLEDALTMMRYDLIDLLQRKLPKSVVKFNHQFESFEYGKNKKLVAANFTNGNSVKADIFLAADGRASKVRTVVFPKRTLYEIREKEIVGVLKDKDLAAHFGEGFMKVISPDGGLSLGIVPAGNHRLIWYLQFDTQKYTSPSKEASKIKQFVLDRIRDWQAPIPALIEKTTVNKIHLWPIALLKNGFEQFYQANLLLLGDAAHPLSTLTSQGVNSALEDASQLAYLFAKFKLKDKPEYLENVFKKFQQVRLPILEEYERQGAVLLEKFLAPFESIDDFQIPLGNNKKNLILK